MTELTVTTHGSIDEVDENQWNTLVQQSDLGSVFHRHGWLRAVERGLDREGRHLVVRKKGNPVAVFPNFVETVDLPDPSVVTEGLPSGALGPLSMDAGVPVDVGIDALDRVPIERLASTSPGFGGPVILTDEGECLPLLLDELTDALSGRTLCHVIKAKEPGYVRYGKSLAGHGYEPTLLDCRFELPLDRPFEDLLDGMAKERRKAIRDGREQAHAVTEAPLAETLDDTYQRYRRDIERTGGEAYPRSFFTALADEFPDRTRVFTLEVDGAVAGQFVHVLDDEQSAVHYFFSAIGDPGNYEYNATELLHAHVIERAADDGYDYYDFGSTGSTFHKGTFRYKEKYGARPLPTLRWERGGSSVLWNAYKVARRGYQKYAYPET